MKRFRRFTKREKRKFALRKDGHTDAEIDNMESAAGDFKDHLRREEGDPIG